MKHQTARTPGARRRPVGFLRGLRSVRGGVASSATTTRGERRSARAVGRGGVATVLALVLAGVGVQAPLAAATTASYELTGAWENAPTSVSSGKGTLSAVWKFDINDDSPAPSNEPVENNTLTLVAHNATFSTLPGVCQTSGVSPASSMSADQRTLVCNIGTRPQGTANVSVTGVVPRGQSGDRVSVTGTFMGKSSTLPGILVDNAFVMDAKFDGGSTSTPEGTLQTASFGWSLGRSTGSVAGPRTVSYDITATASNGERLSLGAPSCTPISSALSGYPFSEPGKAANRSTAFPTCVVTSTGTNRFRMTLSNLNYSGPFPTHDSLGRLLDDSMDVLAAGTINLQWSYGSSGTLSLTASRPTYTSASTPARTSTDDASNNTSTQSFSRGSWAGHFMSRGALSQGSAWKDTFRTYAGATVTSRTSVLASPSNGMCTTLDSRYMSLVSARVGAEAGNDPYTGVTFWYYTGRDAAVDANSSQYNPNAWTGCRPASGASGWSTTAPADLGTVKAVGVIVDRNIINQGTNSSGMVSLYLDQRIRPNVPVGQDIWTWTSYRSGSSWVDPQRGSDPSGRPSQGVLTPTLRYAYTGGGRDVLRTIGSSPLVTKTVDQSAAALGSTVNYTLRYGLTTENNGGPAAQVVLTDTLPAGLSYVAGSASPAPTVTGTVAGGQTLTWTLNNVAVDKTPQDALSYKATLPSSARPGSTFTNRVIAQSQGEQDSSSASVSVPAGGYTALSMDAAAATSTPQSGALTNAFTVTLTSSDTATNDKTDAITILPFAGDGRGTSFSGTLTLDGPIQASSGSTVYYTMAPPSTIKEDPADPSNGGLGTVSGNWIGWSTTYNPRATGVRVMGPALAPGGTQAYTVKVRGTNNRANDTFAALSVARASNTQARMRSSSSFTVASVPAITLKKQVNVSGNTWLDADRASDYPEAAPGRDPRYRLLLSNTGNADLKNLPLSDTKADLSSLLSSGKLSSTIPLAQGSGGVVMTSLPVGAQATVEYELSLSALAPAPGSDLVNTACASAPAGQPDLEKACDPAGIKVLSTLAWNKIGPTGALLEGSEWSLVRVDANGGRPVAGAPVLTVKDCTAAHAGARPASAWDKDPAAGRLLLQELPAGWYRLVETRAPAGYALDSTPRFVQVGGATRAGGAGLVNQIAAAPVIPLTGGVGSYLFLGGAGLAGLLALGGLLWQRRKTS